MDAVNILFSLLRNCVAGEAVAPDLLADTSAFGTLLSLAKKHSLTQLAAYAIVENGLLPADCPEYAALCRQYFTVITKMTQMEHEQKAICRALGEAKIPHILLKGAVMRELYPESWMRTSSDIDVLVREEDLSRAAETLKNALQCRAHGEKNYHDICLVFPSGIPLELHFSVLEDMDNLDRVLINIWDYAVPTEGCGYRETPEFFLFHHLAHMVYHFINGGCGIRFFLDLWVIRKRLNVSLDAIRALTDQAGITAFSEAAFHLADHWMEDLPISETEKRMERYVLEGGCFGSKQNRLTIRQELAGGKGKYLLRRVFPPYENLCALYPRLKDRPYLAPAALVRRWFTVLEPEKRARVQEELSISSSMTDAQRASAVKLLSDLKLI